LTSRTLLVTKVDRRSPGRLNSASAQIGRTFGVHEITALYMDAEVG